MHAYVHNKIFPEWNFSWIFKILKNVFSTTSETSIYSHSTICKIFRNSIGTLGDRWKRIFLHRGESMHKNFFYKEWIGKIFLFQEESRNLYKNLWSLTIKEFHSVHSRWYWWFLVKLWLINKFTILFLQSYK